MCCCPAHDDRTPSLSVRIGETRLLFKCFAGCDISDVLRALRRDGLNALDARDGRGAPSRSEEHTSELQSLMRISYAVFCLKKKNIDTTAFRRKHNTAHTTRNKKINTSTLLTKS